MVRASARRDNGHKVVPALRPPQIVRQPWNSYTFSATYDTSSSSVVTVNIGSIRNQIVGLMGLTGASGRIALKVQSAACWCTSVGPGFFQPSIEGLYWELIPVSSGEVYNVRSEQYDHGTLNIPARTGYVWPLADRKEIHSPETDSHVVCKYSVPTNSNLNITVRIHVLWISSAIGTNRQICEGEETFESIPLPGA
jgi:hypothetical protein